MHSLSTLLMQLSLKHHHLKQSAKKKEKSASAIQLSVFTKSSCCYESHFDVICYFYATNVL